MEEYLLSIFPNWLPDGETQQWARIYNVNGLGIKVEKSNEGYICTLRNQYDLIVKWTRFHNTHEGAADEMKNRLEVNKITEVN